jgi:hypothetical protein
MWWFCGCRALPARRDALLHVCRIHRILSQPRGNALLVGVGGSGRKSLSRLAAYIAEMKVFSIEITNTYRLTEFREDLKGLYRQTGVAGKPTVFLFDESQVSRCDTCPGAAEQTALNARQNVLRGLTWHLTSEDAEVVIVWSTQSKAENNIMMVSCR